MQGKVTRQVSINHFFFNKRERYFRKPIERLDHQAKPAHGESNLRPSAYQPSALTTRPSRLTIQTRAPWPGRVMPVAGQALSSRRGDGVAQLVERRIRDPKIQRPEVRIPPASGEQEQNVRIFQSEMLCWYASAQLPCVHARTRMITYAR